jgi:hypothetical protein
MVTYSSTYAASASATSRFFGHGAKRGQGVVVVSAAECLQRRGGEGDVVDRRVAEGVEPPLQPACRDPRVARRVLERDQRGELEQIDKRGARDLGAQRRLGDDQVAVLDRPLEDRSGMTLRCDPALRSGAGRLPECTPDSKSRMSGVPCKVRPPSARCDCGVGGGGGGGPPPRPFHKCCGCGCDDAYVCPLPDPPPQALSDSHISETDSKTGT